MTNFAPFDAADYLNDEETIQGRHGRDQTHGELYGILGVIAQVMLGKEATKTHPEQYRSEQASRNNGGEKNGIHRLTHGFPLGGSGQAAPGVVVPGHQRFLDNR